MVGLRFTVTKADAVSEQPFTSVTVTTYFVVVNGVAKGLIIAKSDRFVAGLHV
jgi:hypothetical protein